MEEKNQPTILEGELVGIRFGLASHKEISTASVSDCPISHSSQLTNPFLGLPLEFGKCEACGTAEIGKCEGHFGYIELPIPIYHPSHVSELKRMLSLLCLKCLKLKTNKIPVKSGGGVAERLMSCCEDASQISIREIKTSDGASFLQLKIPSRGRLREGFWNFLERYGFRYGDNVTRALLPCEVMEMLKRIPLDARKKLARKGYFPQDGYILKYLPVPPNCLSMPDVSDGISVMSSDLSISMLKKVLKQVDIIKSSRSGPPNFESHEVEARDLQSVVDQYLQVRGTSKSARDVGERFGVHTESNESSTKAWLEKMRTLFIRKGSGFSSRSVITGDAYTRVDQIGLPFEIAQRITFEERVNVHNVRFLQDLVDKKLCLTYRDGSSTYSLREGSKGHTFLRPGQVVHRRIMDGDTVFINRPPTTHKHSLQALSVYVHEDHTVKINPLICGPLSADFDGDCIHLFYPQSLAAKAEVMELFTVEKQLLSSHSGNLNLQLTTDALLSLKTMLKGYFFDKAAAQQLGMFIPSSLPLPALWKSPCAMPIWTALQMLQTALPQFDCTGERYLISKGDLVNFNFSGEIVQAVINEIVISIFFEKGPSAVFKFFNSVQPLLMENLFAEGFSVGLYDFYMSRAAIERIRRNIKKTSPLLSQLRSNYNELVELQMQKHIRDAKRPVEEFILSSSSLGDLIDPKSDSAMTKVVQQIGFLGLQISDRGKFYSRTLFDDMVAHFECNYPSDAIDSPSTKHGLVQSCFFLGLDPYEEMAHSISTREIIVRSSRGLSEPGTLFKNLMAILRDVIICYDGTVRNLCSNTIIQFEYSLKAGIKAQSLFPAGEPVGVLAATAMSNPAYKAVLDSSPSSNSSWDMMKEILLCKVNFKNDDNDRRVILYLNDCTCGRKYCPENVSSVVKNHLKKVTLKDIANCLLIEYKTQQIVADACLIGHIHLNKEKLHELNVSLEVIHQKCKDTIKTFGKKKKIGPHFRKMDVLFSDYCTFEQPCCDDEWPSSPCVTFFSQDQHDSLLELEGNIHLFADIIYPILLGTIIKGDHRISSANIIRVSPDSTSWIRTPARNQRGEFALDVVIEKSAVKQSGDAWRVALDACLPVLHLIDTKRSTPYAIKQVQELLGISCAFDQAAQRLSTSVKMVAKGVLKEHLILLANSMTCAGNLVGFNSGGYKALSRSLDIQVPFTEATLFTPRKCFERAAEKCHTDSLSSVVASCSWGKHVAVGTGSRFDLLWNNKEVCVNQEDTINVYEFLNMVRPGASGEESIPACLGADVDDLDDENDDWNLSPEHTLGTDKPVFEDSAEFEKYAENGTTDGGNWGAGESIGADHGNAWSGWGKKSAEAQPDNSSGWNNAAASKTDAGNSWGFVKSTGADGGNGWSGWGKKASETDQAFPMETQDLPNSSSDWGTSTAPQTDTNDSWGVNKSKGAEEENTWSGWGKKGGETELAVSGSSWGIDKNTGPDVGGAWSGWGKNISKKEDSFSMKAQEKVTESSGGWGTTDEAKKGVKNSWGVERSERADKETAWSSWGKKAGETEQACGADKNAEREKEISLSSWGRDSSKKDGFWTQAAEHVDSPVDNSGWGKLKSYENSQDSKKENSWSGWGRKDSSEKEDAFSKEAQVLPDSSQGWGFSDAPREDDTWSGWGKKAADVPQKDATDSWGVTKSTGANKDDILSGWGKKAGETGGKENSWSGWGRKYSREKEDAFSREAQVLPDSSQGWGSSDAPREDDTWSGWGKKAADVPEKDANDSWSVKKSTGAEKDDSLSGWGKKAGETGEKENSWSGWGRKDSSEKDDAFSAEAQVLDDSSQGWGTTNAPGKDDAWSSWGKKAAEAPQKDVNDSWGVKKRTGADKDDASSGWGKKAGEKKQAWGADKGGAGWGKNSNATNVESPTNSSGWGKLKSSDNSQGWGSRKPDREWKLNKNRPPKPIGTAPDDSSRAAAPMFTATRQRLDMFTSDEQEILTEIEPLMHSIRRIMHKSGYNDGDPLSPTDHAYILDNVFNHHPAKDAKMGPSIDHFMINKHDVFAESKCFYVVSTDGSKKDFSYRKCLENLVRRKYPDLAEEFIPKYFTKPRPRSQPPQTPLTEPPQTPLAEPVQTPLAEPLQTPLGEQPETNKPENPSTDQKSSDGEQLPEH